MQRKSDGPPGSQNEMRSRKHTAEFFEQARYEEVLEKECFDVVKRMNLDHGIDVVLPMLEKLERTMYEKEDNE